MRYNNTPIIGVFKNNSPIAKIYSKGLLIWPKGTNSEPVLEDTEGMWVFGNNLPIILV